MTKKGLLLELENFLRSADFRLIYDDIEGEGGLCELRGKSYIIINRRLPDEFKITIIASELGKLNSLAVPERIREIIEKWGNER